MPAESLASSAATASRRRATPPQRVRWTVRAAVVEVPGYASNRMEDVAVRGQLDAVADRDIRDFAVDVLHRSVAHLNAEAPRSTIVRPSRRNRGDRLDAPDARTDRRRHDDRLRRRSCNDGGRLLRDYDDLRGRRGRCNGYWRGGWSDRVSAASD